MHRTHRYAISPTEALLARAKAEEIFDLLCETFMVESDEGGVRAPAPEEYRLRVKLFVLFNFYNEYALVPEIAEFFQGKEFNEALFDQLWTLQGIEEVMIIPSPPEKLQYTAPAPQLPHTDSEFVNRWLREVVCFQASQEPGNSNE